jgi:ketosteroid isomerase-like protein
MVQTLRMADALPPVALAVSFIEQINRRDLDALAALMSDDHRLEVFDEPPLAGKDANVDAWRGYFDAYPSYVIYPHHIAARDGCVAVVGHTTGSHLQLSDDEERAMTLIWLADTADGLVTRWQLIEDTPANRQSCGLSGD